MEQGPNILLPQARDSLQELTATRDNFEHRMEVREVGLVHTVATGVAQVSGLPGLGYEELVKFQGGGYGIAFNIDRLDNGIVLLCESSQILAGTEVERTGRVMNIPVGHELLGRVLDPLGNPLDERGPLTTTSRLPIERPSPHIMDRAPVREPLQTGIKVIDTLVPIGRGQRQLILGDRQTGKTAIALDTIANQHDKDVVCVYCTIGQRTSSVARAIESLRERGAMEYTVAVVTEGNDPPGLRYLAPYAATAIAEHFMENGHDVLIVYDDLTHHARAYRELSLLLRRPPGREAFPGDIFYLHSRLLERSTYLTEELGGGSLTALPIIETEAENLSDYIPTNLISITDGQLYLSPRLFELGQLPAIDIGKSISRVGGKAQAKVFHQISGPLRLAYSQFEEMEVFARFGTRLDDRTRSILERGRRIRSILLQDEFSPRTDTEQITILIALTGGLFDAVPLEKMNEAETTVKQSATKLPPELSERLFTDDKVTDDDRALILQIAKDSL